MQEIQANTAIKVKVGPFVDVGDGFTPETGVTLGAADEAEVFKHDAAAVTDISGNTWAAIGSCDGWYNLTLTAGNLDTEGLLDVIVQDDSVCLPVHCRFMVLAQAAWISKYTAKDSGYMDVNVKAISEDTTSADNCEADYDGTGYVGGTIVKQADVTKVGGVAQSATDFKDFADTGYDPSTHKVQGVVLTDTCTTNTDVRGTDNAATEAKQDIIDTVVDGIQTDLSNVTDGLGALKALLDAIKAITDALPDSGALTTINNYVDLIDDATNGLAAIKAEVEGLAGAAMRGTDNAATEAKQDIIDTVVDGIQTDLSNVTDGLGALKALIDANKTAIDAIQTDLDNGTDGLGALKTEIDANETKIDTVDTVVDGIQTDLSNATDGLGALKTEIDANETKIDTVDTVVDGIQTDLSNATDGLGALRALIITVDTVADAVKAKTDNLPSGIEKGVERSFTFPMILSSDGETFATGKTITDEISKDKGNFATCTNDSAEIQSTGIYGITITATEMDAM